MNKKIKRVKLEYPRTEGNANAILLDLIDVRASDGILIEYDFYRDGWVISQPTVLKWDIDDKECDPKYKESAFIPSWQYIEDDE
ncbi:hypothetical protein [Heyndrickxia camelliae]|nr:hypothetical protein [Heyndrickxia camelliae]